jgi:hypothetical protein
LVGRLEREGDLVEQIEREVVGGVLLGEPLQSKERTVFGREQTERLKRIGGRAFKEDEGLGLELAAGHREVLGF